VKASAKTGVKASLKANVRSNVRRPGKSQADQRRHYNDACATAHAMDLIGDRWALLVVRELMWGAKRFSDLRASLPAISANVLTQRLAGLEAAGVLMRRRLPPPAASQVYELTAWGYESEPVFQALGRWASRSPIHDPSLPFGTSSLLLSLRTMLDPDLAEGIDAGIGFRLGGESFLAHLAEGEIEIAPVTDDTTPLDEADVIFSGTARMIAAAIYGGQRLVDLEAAGAVTIEGDRRLAKRFVTLFPLPPKAALPGLYP
jgi:DNA-binding HxlR family transcriptional regulator